jgi:hypothetical protein
VAVLLIGTNDLTNSAWSARVQSVKEKALAKEAPGIVSRCRRGAAARSAAAGRAAALRGYSQVSSG